MTAATRSSIRRVFWGLATLDLLLLVGGIVGVIVPDVRAWRHARAEVQVVTAARIAVEHELQPLEDGSGVSAERLSLLNRLDAVFPTSPNLPQIYDEVADLVQRSGLALSGIDAEEVASEVGQPVRRIQITVRVSGFTYPTLKRLVGLIEQAPRLYDLKSVALSGEAPQATLTFWTYAFTPSNE